MNSRRCILFAIVVAVAVVTVSMVLTACGSSSKSTSSTNSPGADLQTVTSGVLTIGSTYPYPPFVYNDSSGNLTGWGVEELAAVAEHMGLKAVWVNTDFSTIFTALAHNRFDLVGPGITAYANPGTPAYNTVQQRMKVVTFAEPYMDIQQALTVNVAKTPDILSVDNLTKGDKVAVQAATSAQYLGEQILTPKGVSLVTFPESPQMFQALKVGQVKAVLYDSPTSVYVVGTSPELKIVQRISTGEEYACAFAKNRPALLAAFNVAVTATFKDGTYARILEKYFPGEPVPSYAH
jgi:polar amino acid transport system substrate-binding protein